MMKTNNKVNLGQLLFHLAYMAFLISTFMTKVIFMKHYISIFKYFSIFAFFISFLIQSNGYNKKELVKIYLLIVLNLIVYYITKDNSLLILFLIFFTTKNLKFEKVIKFDILCKTMITILLFILYKGNYTESLTFYRDGIERFAFGYGHPNTFGFVAASIFIEFIYLKRDALKWFYFIPILFFAFVIDYYADSRSSVILLLLVVIFILLKNSIAKNILNNKYIKKIICNSWIIFSLITVIMTILYYKNTSIGIYLDELLSTRLKCIVNFLTEYKIKLFGNNLLLINSFEAQKLGVRARVLDNAYIHFLLRYGVVFYMLFAYYFNKMFKLAYNQKNIVLVFILFIFLCYGISETIIFKISYNVFLIFIGNVIYKTKEGE